MTNTCSRCGQEVRYGTRGLVTGWLHREDVDHVPIFGRPWTAEDEARANEELDRVRTRVKDDGTEETYTARRHSLKGDAAKEYDASHQTAAAIPEPEQRATPVDPDTFPPRSGIRQIINLISRTDGWDLTSVTKARGPYMGSGGEVLSISDSILVRASGPDLDNGKAVAVASWRDGAFDFAYTGILKDGVVTSQPANSASLKAWVKETTP